MNKEEILRRSQFESKGKVVKDEREELIDLKANNIGFQVMATLVVVFIIIDQFFDTELVNSPMLFIVSTVIAAQCFGKYAKNGKDITNLTDIINLVFGLSAFIAAIAMALIILGIL